MNLFLTNRTFFFAKVSFKTLYLASDYEQKTGSFMIQQQCKINVDIVFDLMFGKLICIIHDIMANWKSEENKTLKYSNYQWKKIKYK